MKWYTVTVYVETDDETSNRDVSVELYRVLKTSTVTAVLYDMERTHPGKAEVILFKDSGKYYTREHWTIPDQAIGPGDMIHSPDFRRISGTGAVLVPTQEPWGYPHLIPGLDPRSYNEGLATAEGRRNEP